MDLTENLQIPYILPSQAQKHVTHNEAIKVLDAIVQLAVETRALATPPATPAAGVRYIVPAGATGEWAGRENMVAAWQDDAWTFRAPQTGWIAYAVDENAMIVFLAGNWVTAAFDVSLPERLGINATANAPNRMAIGGAFVMSLHIDGFRVKGLNAAFFLVDTWSSSCRIASHCFCSSLSMRSKASMLNIARIRAGLAVYRDPRVAIKLLPGPNLCVATAGVGPNEKTGSNPTDIQQLNLYVSIRAFTANTG